MTDVWNEPMPAKLAAILVGIQSPDTMQAFLRDVMTEKELREIGARLRAAEMLYGNATYTAIVKETKLSSRTIARISEWMQHGAGGYLVVLNETHPHVSPVDVG